MPEVMQRLNQYMPPRQVQALRQASQQSSYSVAELMRRMIDHCLQPQVFGALFPTLSGQSLTMR
mgnify:CR=1 FL=1